MQTPRVTLADTRAEASGRLPPTRDRPLASGGLGRRRASDGPVGKSLWSQAAAQAAPEALAEEQATDEAGKSGSGAIVGTARRGEASADSAPRAHAGRLLKRIVGTGDEAPHHGRPKRAFEQEATPQKEFIRLSNCWAGTQRTRLLVKKVENFVNAAGLYGGADIKRLEFDGVTLEMQLEMERAETYVKRIKDMWHHKGGTLVQELQNNIVMPEKKYDTQVDQPTLFALSALLAGELKHEGGAFSHFEPLAILCMVLYTQQDVDIDRLLFDDVPNFPQDEKDRTPEGRDNYYKAYRADPGARNQMMFQDANSAVRTFWMGDPSSQRQARDKLQKYIKWICLLTALRQPVRPPVETVRGLCNLPMEFVDMILNMRPGEPIFWPSMASSSWNFKVAEEYANQPAPAGKGNILFRICGITEGLDIQSVSQYAAEKEFLLPMFTVLKVLQVKRGPPHEVRCEYLKTLMPLEFQDECLADLRSCWVALVEQAHGAAAKSGTKGAASPSAPGEPRMQFSEANELHHQLLSMDNSTTAASKEALLHFHKTYASEPDSVQKQLAMQNWLKSIDENERLKQENEQLRNEIEQLRQQVVAGSSEGEVVGSAVQSARVTRGTIPLSAFPGVHASLHPSGIYNYSPFS